MKSPVLQKWRVANQFLKDLQTPETAEKAAYRAAQRVRTLKVLAEKAIAKVREAEIQAFRARELVRVARRLTEKEDADLEAIKEWRRERRRIRRKEASRETQPASKAKKPDQIKEWQAEQAADATAYKDILRINAAARKAQRAKDRAQPTKPA